MSTQLLDKIRAWLKDNGKSRQDLADLIGVSKRTVDNWFSGRTMNVVHEKALKVLLSPSADEEESGKIVLRFTDEQMERLKKNFSSREELEMAIKSFCLGSMYARAGEICRAHGLIFDEDGNLEAAEPEE